MDADFPMAKLKNKDADNIYSAHLKVGFNATELSLNIFFFLALLKNKPVAGCLAFSLPSLIPQLTLNQ